MLRRRRVSRLCRRDVGVKRRIGRELVLARDVVRLALAGWQLDANLDLATGAGEACNRKRTLVRLDRQTAEACNRACGAVVARRLDNDGLDHTERGARAL